MSEAHMPIVELVERYADVRKAVAHVIVGQDAIVDLTMTALACEGHVLFEGVPGLGKTLLSRALAASLDLRFSRLQFTPDLMPADIVGSSMVSRSNDDDISLTFERGPVFANIVLADEINRASPKTQSALLEAMQERAVTVRGAGYPLPRPFMVLATQNPLEMEGTYPLPEAQIDRFLFKVIVAHPEEEELVRILERTHAGETPFGPPRMDGESLLSLQRAVRDVVVPPGLLETASRIVLATRPERPEASDRIKRFVRFGSGPRGAQALVIAAKARALLDGRLNASMRDLVMHALPALRHRIALNFEGLSEGILVEDLLGEVMEKVSGQSRHDEAVRN